MTCTGSTQKQRLADWEAHIYRGLHDEEKSTERKSLNGFELKKTSNDGEDHPGAGSEGEAGLEAGEAGGTQAGGR